MHGTLTDVKVIKDAVRLACRAPSLHNSQSWRLDLDGKGVHLFLDTSRGTVTLVSVGDLGGFVG